MWPDIERICATPVSSSPIEILYLEVETVGTLSTVSRRMKQLFPYSGLLARSSPSFFVWRAVLASLTNSRSFCASPFGET